MGVPVTVDSDDLGVLVQAATAVKGVEQAVAIAANDDGFLQAKPKIADVTQRVANQWRGALRDATFKRRTAPLTPPEVEHLKNLARQGAAEPWGIEILKEGPYINLVFRGVAEIGTHQERIIWDNGSGTIWSQQSPLKRMRLTDRGIAAMGGPLELETLPQASVFEGLWDQLRAAWKKKDT